MIGESLHTSLDPEWNEQEDQSCGWHGIIILWEVRFFPPTGITSWVVLWYIATFLTELYSYISGPQMNTNNKSKAVVKTIPWNATIGLKYRERSVLPKHCFIVVSLDVFYISMSANCSIELPQHLLKMSMGMLFQFVAPYCRFSAERARNIMSLFRKLCLHSLGQACKILWNQHFASKYREPSIIAQTSCPRCPYCSTCFSLVLFEPCFVLLNVLPR